jgi:hypothetical protein
MRFLLALSLACGLLVFTLSGKAQPPTGGADLYASNPFAEPRK